MELWFLMFTLILVGLVVLWSWQVAVDVAFGSTGASPSRSPYVALLNAIRTVRFWGAHGERDVDLMTNPINHFAADTCQTTGHWTLARFVETP